MPIGPTVGPPQPQGRDGHGSKILLDPPQTHYFLKGLDLILKIHRVRVEFGSQKIITGLGLGLDPQ